jgi:hypothetical protein
MTDTSAPVTPQAEPPAPTAPSIPVRPPPLPATPAPQTASKKSGGGGSIAAAIVALLLLDLAVETFLAGSPLLISVGAVEVLAIVLLALLWTRVGPTTRLAIPLIGLVGLVAWAALRVGSWADPALRLATLTLPRLGVVLAILATAAATGLLFGLRVIRRAWYIGALLALVGLYALVPLMRGLLAGAALTQVLAGGFDWQRLPSWLQGGYVATEVVLPIGLLAGLAGLITSVVKHTRVTWTAAGLVVVIAAFVVQSAELTRAGRSHLAGVATSPLLATVSTVAAPDPASLAPGAAPLSSPGAGPGTAPGVVSPGPDAVPQQAASAPVIPAPAGAVAIAQVGQPIANKAIEVRVTNHRTAASIGSQNADPGREFVIVESSWKNIIPKVKVNRKKAQDRTGGMGSLGFGGGTTEKDKAADEANTTLESMAFEVSPLPKHLWLVADGRYAEPIDTDGTQALEGHLSPEKLSIAEFQQVVSGGLAFQAPANAQSLALLFLDTIHGHLLLTIKGAPPVLASSLGGSGRANELVDLALTGASWSNAPAPAAGMRTLIVGLRGISRQNAIVDVPFGQYAFLQTEQGCLAEPDQNATGLTRQLAPVGRFLPFVPTEGQLAFAVPADTKAAALLVRLQQGGPIDLAVMGTVKPAWPSPEATITDGDVLRVLKLPGTAVPPGLPAAPSGSERVALDLVVENLRSGAGIDLQLNEQFRLVGPDGKRYEPSSDSAHAPCRLTGDVVPAGSARRFTLVFDVPPGQPLQFEYRGFNVKSELVKVR